MNLRPFLTEKVKLTLPTPPYHTCNARDQPNFAHDVFSKRKVEYAIILVGNVMAPRPHVHIFCSNLLILSVEQKTLGCK